MPKYKDYSGRRFGQLTAVEYMGLSPMPSTKYGPALWKCKCDCGKEITIRIKNATKGKTRSCGCLLRPGLSNRANDITNKRFGKLVAIKPIRKNRNIYWECQCDCGNKTTVIVAELNRKRKSCGCLHVEKKTTDDSLTKRYYSTYRRSAISRAYEFSITLETFKKLIKDKCRYCDAPPIESNSPRSNGFMLNGVDRKDNVIGYTNENCCTSCSICNRMKMVMGENLFIEHCKKIAFYNGVF